MTRPQVELDDARGEILRLVSVLRSRRRSQEGRAATVAQEPTPARTAEPPEPPLRQRVLQRQQELADLRQLRQWLQAHLSELKSSDAALERLEQAVKRVEEKLGRSQLGSVAVPKATRAPAVLHRAASDRPSYAFSGRIQGQMVADMLQTVSSNGMSGVFVVEIEDERTELYFEEGRMCHAKSGDLTGEPAFFAAFSAESGRYFFRELQELPAERTINASTQLLILEALRQIDEKNRE